jgi:magnesium-protoporphyrin O-methyltransferase
MMPTPSYLDRRDQLETYFDRTAVDAWARLTTDAPVGRIRATVREGRNEMRTTMASWLPEDLRGRRILDAGCGTGALAAELASRGAHVVAVDLSEKLVSLARERYGSRIGDGHLDFVVGDMLHARLETFDHVVAMDSLIHYDASDIVKALALISGRVKHSIVFTFIPRTPILAAMHAVGRFFPKNDRSPSLRPLGETHLRQLIAADPALARWQLGRTRCIARGFYTSQALELSAS